VSLTIHLSPNGYVIARLRSSRGNLKDCFSSCAGSQWRFGWTKL